VRQPGQPQQSYASPRKGCSIMTSPQKTPSRTVSAGSNRPRRNNNQRLRRSFAVFDLDGTITKRGTFTPFLLSTRPSLAAKICLLAKLFKEMIWYKLGQIDRTTLKNRMLSHTFSSAGVEKIGTAAEHFVKQSIPNGLRQGCDLAFTMHRLEGDELVLATAAIDIYAELFARELGFDKLVCTRTTFTERATHAPVIVGNNCYGEEKLAKVKKLLLADSGLSREEIFVSCYTDHHADLPLLRWSDVAVVINPGSRTRALAAGHQMTILKW